MPQAMRTRADQGRGAVPFTPSVCRTPPPTLFTARVSARIFVRYVVPGIVSNIVALDSHVLRVARLFLSNRWGCDAYLNMRAVWTLRGGSGRGVRSGQIKTQENEKTLQLVFTLDPLAARVPQPAAPPRWPAPPPPPSSLPPPPAEAPALARAPRPHTRSVRSWVGGEMMRLRLFSRPRVHPPLSLGVQSTELGVRKASPAVNWEPALRRHMGD